MATWQSPAPRGPSRPARQPHQSVSDWIFEAVKNDIINARLGPEDTLVEGALASLFGVSRAPAREALQRLRQTNLVRAVPRLGYIVTPVGLRDYTEVFQMRLALEPVAIELATIRVREGREDCRHLEALAEQSLEFLTDDSPDRGGRVAQTNKEFHHGIALLSGNQRLAAAVESVLDELQRVLVLVAYDAEALAEMSDDHPSLVRAMKSGDARGAAELMRTQLERGFTVMRDSVIREQASDLVRAAD